MDKDDRKGFVLALVLGLLAARALRAFLSSLSWESLATLRLNGTAFWVLLLLLPLLAPRRHVWWLALAAGLASALLGPMRLREGYLPVAGLAAGLALAAAVRLPTAGFALGLALDAALLVANGSVDPTLGAVTGTLAVLATMAAALAYARGLPTHDAPPRVLDGLAFAALLGVELAFLANPFGLARQLGLPAPLIGGASLLGLVLGATRLRHLGAPLAAAGALALLDVALVRSPVVAGSAFLAQLAVGAAFARLRPAPLLFAPAFALVAFQLVFFARPFGWGDWTVVLPALGLAGLALAAIGPRETRPMRLEGAVASPMVLAIVLLAMIPAPPASEDGDPATLRVVTWNVRQGFGNRGALDVDLYASVLRELDADVIVLQESGPPELASGGVEVPHALGSRLGMHATAGSAGIAILSRTPFVEVVQPHAVWTHEAAIDVDGTTVWVQGAHLGRSSISRLEQANDTLASADARPGPRILAGDMNTCHRAAPCFGATPVCAANGSCVQTSPIYERLDATLDDAWILAGKDPLDPSGNTHHAQSHGGPSRRIDHVWLAGFEVVDVFRVLTDETRLGSDHLPVVADLRLADVAEP